MVWRYRPNEPNFKPHSPCQNAWIRNRNSRKTFGSPFFNNEYSSCNRTVGSSSSFPNIGVVIEYGIFATIQNGSLGRLNFKTSICLTLMFFSSFILLTSLRKIAGSFSIAITCAAFFAYGKVIAPEPAPISSTVSRGLILARSINSLIKCLFISKCCPEKLAVGYLRLFLCKYAPHSFVMVNEKGTAQINPNHPYKKTNSGYRCSVPYITECE